MTYAVGSLARARGQEWVVLPESEEDMLVLRPRGGTEDEVAAIYLSLEPAEPATFDMPDPMKWGDYRSSRLLRDAVRLGFRSSAVYDALFLALTEERGAFRHHRRRKAPQGFKRYTLAHLATHLSGAGTSFQVRVTSPKNTATGPARGGTRRRRDPCRIGENFIE